MLGLALAAGSVLSTLFSNEASSVIRIFGVVPTEFVTDGVISAVIIVLPMLILLLRGPRHRTLVGRTVGAIITTALALAFLIEPLATMLPSAGWVVNAYGQVMTYRRIIIGIGLILAIGDLLIMGLTPASSERRYRR